MLNDIIQIKNMVIEKNAANADVLNLGIPYSMQKILVEMADILNAKNVKIMPAKRP